MTNASPHFFTLSLLVLATITAVFAMKYAAVAYRGRLELRKQTATDEKLDALQQGVSALNTRVSAVEKLLREVE